MYLSFSDNSIKCEAWYLVPGVSQGSEFITCLVLQSLFNNYLIYNLMKMVVVVSVNCSQL